YLYKKYKTLIVRLFEVSKSFISETRVNKNSDTLFKNFEALYIRTICHERPFFQYALEALTVVPWIRLTAFLFSAHIRSINLPYGYFLLEIFKFKGLPGEISYGNSE